MKGKLIFVLIALALGLGLCAAIPTGDDHFNGAGYAAPSGAAVNAYRAPQVIPAVRPVQRAENDGEVIGIVPTRRAVTPIPPGCSNDGAWCYGGR